MRRLDYVEFYITNVCNFNCENCNRFNNFAFKGHHKWEDHARHYEKWAEIIDFEKIAILGGEPLLNPDFMSWLHGIATLWPRSEINIVTNGSQLGRWPRLYQALVEYQGRAYLEVSYHSEEDSNDIAKEVDAFLQQPIEKTVVVGREDLWTECYNKIKDPSWRECRSMLDWKYLPEHVRKECEEIHGFSPDIFIRNNGQENYGFQYVDANNVRVELNPAWRFHSAAIRFENSRLSLHCSDPTTAAKNCDMLHCHHFIGGKLYKCGVVGILPEFVTQFPVDISKEEMALLSDYRPAEHHWHQDDLDRFLEDLAQGVAIPQCQFCPESYTYKKFSASQKKIKIVKINHPGSSDSTPSETIH